MIVKMIKLISKYSIIIVLGFFSFTNVYSQKYTLPFGDIGYEELLNKPYKPDPGADAIILSDLATASLNYANGFYVEFERDVRIRIVNSNGFDYANIEIPIYKDDLLEYYRASTFNTKNGEIAQTPVPKKSFIIDKTTKSFSTLKFSFPDVHEGSVIEYQYKISMNKGSMFDLVPWEFQSDIPTRASALTISYPEYFIYKNIISGDAMAVRSSVKHSKSYLYGESMDVINNTWYVNDMPAFMAEPYIKSQKEHLTKITFELGSVNFPHQSVEEVTPTYKTLTTKLLERDDFGQPLKSKFTSLAKKLTSGMTDDLSKLKSIHHYVSSKLLWNGDKDYTASSTLRNVLSKGKGNSADLNMILICMLRSVNIKADPVILSTRSNGSINELSAMVQQFNYMLAYVTVDGKNYLIDATDPLRPFDELPFDCLNGTGRLIIPDNSRFVVLKNDEKYMSSSRYNLNLDTLGNIQGSMETRYSGYDAVNSRNLVRIEGKEGYSDRIKSLNSGFDFSDFSIINAENPDSVLDVKLNFTTSTGTQFAGDEIIFYPALTAVSKKSPFYSPERKYPVDFGCPMLQDYKMYLRIPDGYSISQYPENASVKLGKDDGSFELKSEVKGNYLEMSSSFHINRTLFPLSEYKNLQSFYGEFLKKQAEPVVIKKISKNL
jgi:hypothetical protein